MRKFKNVISSIVMVLLAVFLCMISGCSSELEDNIVPTVWHFGTQSPTEQGFSIEANSGDLYLDTDDGNLYLLKKNKWELQGNINKNKDITEEDLKGKDGESISDFKISYSVADNGTVYAEINTEFTGEKEAIPVVSPMPLLVKEVSIDRLYYIKNEDDKIYCNAEYLNGQKKVIEITEDMFIIDETYEMVDLTKAGSYNIKINYYGRKTTAEINVIEQEDNIIRSMDFDDDFLFINVDDNNNICSELLMGNIILNHYTYQEKITLKDAWDKGRVSFKFLRDAVEYSINDVEKIIEHDIILTYTSEQNNSFETNIKGVVYSTEGTKQIYAYTNYGDDYYDWYKVSINISFKNSIVDYNLETKEEIKNVLIYTVAYRYVRSFDYGDIYYTNPIKTYQFKLDISEDDIYEPIDKSVYGDHFAKIKTSELPLYMQNYAQEFSQFKVRVYKNDNSVYCMAGVNKDGELAQTYIYNDEKEYFFDSGRTGRYGSVLGFFYYDNDGIVSQKLADNGWGIRLYYKNNVDNSICDQNLGLYYIDVDITTEMAYSAETNADWQDGYGYNMCSGSYYKNVCVFSESEGDYYYFKYYFDFTEYDSGI